MSNQPSSDNPSGFPQTLDASQAELRILIQNVLAVIRAKLRDYPALNRLVAGKVHSDRQIALAVLLVVDDWNITPPLLETITLKTYPSLSLLTDGVIVELLRSEGYLQARNKINYSDGVGVSMSSSDKAPELFQTAGMLAQQYEQKKRSLKIAQNINGAMNNNAISSQYALINCMFPEGSE